MWIRNPRNNLVNISNMCQLEIRETPRRELMEVKDAQPYQIIGFSTGFGVGGMNIPYVIWESEKREECVEMLNNLWEWLDTRPVKVEMTTNLPKEED